MNLEARLQHHIDQMAPHQRTRKAGRLLIEALQRLKELREECAKIAEQTVCDEHTPTGIKVYGSRAAKAIRNNLR